MPPRSNEAKAKAREARAARSLRRCHRARSLQACRKQVFRSGDPTARAGKLTRSQLTTNAAGKVVSRAKSELASGQYRDPHSGLRRWNEAARRCYDELSDGTDSDASSPAPPPKRPKFKNKSPSAKASAAKASAAKAQRTSARKTKGIGAARLIAES